MKLPALARETHLPTRVADLLRAEIEAGRLRPGDQLPTEHALAANLGVSRNVVREAIARLRSEGIVQSRQGVGAFLAPSPTARTLRIDRDVLKNQEDFQHVFELRAMLEIRAAGLAAERRTPQGIRDLKATLARMRDSKKWEEDGVEADLDFHRAVAQATGNPYLTKIISFVSGQVRESIVETRARLGTLAEVVKVTIAEHEAIYAAIRDGSPAAARKAMARHISNAAVRLGIEITVDHRS